MIRLDKILGWISDLKNLSQESINSFAKQLLNSLLDIKILIRRFKLSADSFGSSAGYFNLNQNFCLDVLIISLYTQLSRAYSEP